MDFRPIISWTTSWVFLDYNGLQMTGKVEDVNHFTDPAARWRAFGWHVLEIDGH